ncbi:MAG: hypothetical protein QM802_14340 [Agriterribacter sp.]
MRTTQTVQHLVSEDWNVENLSYFPVVLSRYGYYDQAYKYILHLSNPTTDRREYPEVSFGVTEGIIQGLMGIEPDARYASITTLYNGKTNDTLTVQNLPVLKGLLSVKETATSTILQFSGKSSIHWRATFNGKYDFIQSGNKKIKATHTIDKRGHVLSFIDVLVMPQKEVRVSVK